MLLGTAEVNGICSNLTRAGVGEDGEQLEHDGWECKACSHSEQFVRLLRSETYTYRTYHMNQRSHS